MQKNKYNNSLILIVAIILTSFTAQSQTAILKGVIKSENNAVELAKVFLQETQVGTVTDTTGKFIIKNILSGTFKVIVIAIGYDKVEKIISIKENEIKELNIELTSNSSSLNEVVISGTMKEVSKLESPVPVEVYTAKFFKTNPTQSIFDALQNVNGVRPQLNCNVCYTGDIHINGLEGPYTMVLIDGMPIVSGLSSVYGLSGIPQSLIERVEIVKGPASTLYGSEAVGGIINIITKKPSSVSLFSTDIFATSWGEINTDIAGKLNVGNKVQSLIGLNYFNYSIPFDNNNDGFTDLTMQNRISVFNKWNFSRKKKRTFSLAGRYIYEERWGGEMNWNKSYRGGDEVYGESIYTSRWEFLGTYQLPFNEKILFQFSANGHDQNSVYGKTPYIAQQYIGFGQLTWNKEFKMNELLIGATYRYTFYDDYTPVTASFDTIGAGKNMPSNTYLPGVFVQDEISINAYNKLLLGIRYDYNSIHGHIASPRLNYKWSSKNKSNILRLGIGNGYRVANVFTEDHAALTGARKVEFISDLKPETSWNGNINFIKKIFTKYGMFIGLDATAYYTYFSNKIIADYDTNPNKIIYDNIDEYAVSKGVSLNIDIALNNGLKFLIGGTYMDVYNVESAIKEWQLFSEHFTGVWNIGYSIKKIGFTVDYTGNVYSPMRLPLLSDTDPRSEFSPWWSIQNIQFTKKINKGCEIYGGVKNLLNWTPNKGNPFIIARTNDPFDKDVLFDSNGQAIVTSSNPYGLTFDPSYVYGSNQGIRGFLGIRFTFN
ncbi:MAG TPA: TonB-dependent receptor [Chitinophagaceae bacterium]|nr:TonB-dependent receptor [Chitinophagaceae bacterium]